MKINSSFYRFSVKQMKLYSLQAVIKRLIYYLPHYEV